MFNIVNFMVVLITIKIFADKSPLLLCRDDSLSGDSLTDSSSLHGIIPKAPVCINSTDLQVYKGRKLRIVLRCVNIKTERSSFSYQQKIYRANFDCKWAYF